MKKAYQVRNYEKSVMGKSLDERAFQGCSGSPWNQNDNRNMFYRVDPLSSFNPDAFGAFFLCE